MTRTHSEVETPRNIQDCTSSVGFGSRAFSCAKATTWLIAALIALGGLLGSISCGNDEKLRDRHDEILREDE